MSRRKNKMGIMVGIDASNLRVGGGVTHLSRLLSVADLRESGIERVIVWAGGATLERLPDRPWLRKTHVRLLDRALPLRLFWQQVVLPLNLREMGCHVLFSPGGTLPYLTSVPGFVMSQNLLPFEPGEAARFGIGSGMWLKMKLLRRLQSVSIKKARGVIFLTRYAKERVSDAVGKCPDRSATIPHGIEPRFFMEPRPAKPISFFSRSNPFRILYVSMVDAYKHQWQVAWAIGRLKNRGLPVEAVFVGSSRASSMKRLERVLQELDPGGEYLRYAGDVPYDQLHAEYRQADVFVFASSCENLPNILLEAMAGGLPIACSSRGPMPEILGGAGVYFDPESPGEIEGALRQLIDQPRLRERLAGNAHTLAKNYSWQRCADETFSFIAKGVGVGN